MASLLRQIVAGPRARHAEAGLDLCYVTDFIIATSGPSQTYPQLAYRNPLDQLVAFLDAKHGDNWAIWEFRAEGTGYPDEAVYGRVRHYPWPDHHPPPFRLVPIIMAGMRNWLHGGALPDSKQTPSTSHHPTQETTSLAAPEEKTNSPPSSKGAGPATARDEKRVVVVHCKAGKGRSGTMATSYLVSEEGWTPEDALARFTAQRMRPKFGAGVSIPSQLRWVSYVDRWTKHGKKYLDRPIEIVEIHVWGLRYGVKVDVSGFADNGRKIQVLHTFSKQERHVVRGGMPKDTSIGDMLWELAGYGTSGAGTAANKAPEGVEGDLAEASNLDNEEENSGGNGTGTGAGTGAGTEAPTAERRRHKYIRKGTALIQKVSANGAAASESAKAKPSSNGTATTDPTTTTTTAAAAAAAASTSTSKDQGSTTTTTTTDGDSSTAPSPAEDLEPGGQAVIFRPLTPILVPTSDIHVGLERRNKTHKSLSSLTMVSAMAHVWFNAFFEGQGPEQDGRPSESGVFSIEWHAMDGIKGSSRKGSQALDRMSVVWRAVGHGEGERGQEGEGEMILEPAEGEPVPQLEAADWRGVEGKESGLGLRLSGESSGSVDGVGGCGDDDGMGVGIWKGAGSGKGTDDGDGHAAPAVAAADGKAADRVQ
ncbi:hypothetical protein E4U56_001696 [Claviceps arundinis]|uniref:phosphatidylinositol-3,4,5-trisphosphate 3-phosphatase n=1 Tax=Claviceps arundinis TaxID=1623583 RepID=A0A9P7SRI5_9HYPO|nr:hypothetical protein E4U56_001696 [Claviceps arundinis]